MSELSPIFRELAELYARTPIEFPQLKEITLAQWMLESGRGNSELAKSFFNFGGLKWRKEMEGLATPVEYDAHDGLEKYCSFSTKDKFIQGYWKFLTREPYLGWRSNTDTGEEFIAFVGPIYCPNAGYVQKVLALLTEARNLLSAFGHTPGPPPPEMRLEPGTGTPLSKPKLKEFIQSPNHSSRNGVPIRRIVLHYTGGPKASGAISHFLKEPPENPNPVSAHYIIDKNGDIYQMVKDSDKAWHARGANSESIGIEHVARENEQMTPAQQQASAALIKWLVAEYHLPLDAIVGHRFVPGCSTDCPHSLFGAQTADALKNWVSQNIA